LEKDFIFSLERMSATSVSSKPNSKDNSSGFGGNAGIIIGLILLFVLIFFGIWGTCTDSGKSTFANIKNKITPWKSGGNALRGLDIIMFMSPTCPWCKKMIGVIESEGELRNVTVVNITKPEGAAMAQQFGADKQPVPSFISRQLKTATVGYRDSVSKLIEALTQPPQVSGSSEEPEIPSGDNGSGMNVDIKSLQIILFAREGCSFCTMAKENLSQTGIIDAIQIIDITTPEGQELAGQVLPPGTSGVPAWVSLTTKKHVVGFKPFDQIIQALQ
jgi:thioredoxin-related protein